MAPTSELPAKRWVRVAQIETLDGDGPFAFSEGGIDAVLVRSRGRLRAYAGRCPHQGALLAEGGIDGNTLVCANHGWRFDLETGQRPDKPECLKAIPVRENAGWILLDGSDAAAASEPEKNQTKPTRQFHDLPGPRGFPLLGNTTQIALTRMHLVLEDWARVYGPLYRIKLGPRRAIVVSDPELIGAVLRRRPDIYGRIDNFEPIFAELGLSGVFSAEDESWRAQRGLTLAALAQRRLDGFFPVLGRVAQRLLKRWQEAAQDGRTLDLQVESMLFTTDVVTSLAFGYDADSISGETDVLRKNLSPIFPALAKRTTAPFPWWRYVKLPEDRRLERSIAAVRDWLAPVIDGTRKTLADEPARAEQPRNFVEAMLAARDEHGLPFSEDLIFGNAMTMLLAGEDTTANTLAWAVHHLIDAPEATERLRLEIDTVLGDDRAPTRMEQAQRLFYARGIGHETLRLRPVAPMLFMTSRQDQVLGDVDLPPGSHLILLLRLPGLDPKRVDEPEHFRPERWLDRATVTSLQRDFVQVPFGSGPRVCPGRNLALIEIQTVLGLLYRNFDVQRVGKADDVSEHFAFSMAPKGLRIRLHARRH